jgi:hypothetical protein
MAQVIPFPVPPKRPCLGCRRPVEGLGAWATGLCPACLETAVRAAEGLPGNVPPVFPPEAPSFPGVAGV